MKKLASHQIPRLLLPLVAVLAVQLALTHAQANNNDTTLLGESEGGVGPAAEGAAEGGLVFGPSSVIRPNESLENKIDIVQKARKNEFNSEMITNRTRALVSCETGEILVKINFTEPFRGLAYADYDSSSPCKFFGDGGTYYEMRLPLKGCGTKQEAPRLFVNNIVVRFHRSLQLEEDEEKTIVCRYPPPQAPAPPPPPGLPAKIVEALPEPARLTQYEPFILIAGLLFFALLLAGIGTTSYVVRKETIKPINTPLPITAQTDYDNYIDNQTVRTIEDLETTQKIMPAPKLSSHTFDDVFITVTHEIDTVEDFVHHKRTLPKAHLECHNLEDSYITNQEEITSEELLEQRRLKEQQRRLDQQACDDVYLTNQDEIIEDEQTTHKKLMMDKPKFEVRTIEDTFVTNVDEIVEKEDTTYLKGRGQRQRCDDALEPYHERRDEERDYSTSRYRGS